MSELVYNDGTTSTNIGTGFGTTTWGNITACVVNSTTVSFYKNDVFAQNLSVGTRTQWRKIVIDNRMAAPNNFTMARIAIWNFTAYGSTEPPAAAPTPSVGAGAARESHFDNVLGGNTTINTPTYTDILLENVVITNDTKGYLSSTTNIFSSGSSTTQCRITVNDTDYSSAITRTNTAGKYGIINLLTSNITFPAGTYAVALECRRSGGGAYTITQANIIGNMNNISLDSNSYTSLAVTPTYANIQTDTYTTTNISNNATFPLWLVADYDATYTYSANGQIETRLEIGGKNCSFLPRYGLNGQTGSVGGSCFVQATNNTAYTINLYGQGNGSITYTLAIKEMVLIPTEINSTTLNGTTVSNGSSAKLASINISLTSNTKDIFVKAGIPTNGTTNATYQLRLTGTATQNANEYTRSLDGTTGVAILQTLFKNLNIGDYYVELWGNCASLTCDIRGGELLAYVGDQLATQVTGFTVTVLDLFNNSQISSFNVEYQNINFSTTNASIIIPTNDNTANFTITTTNYIGETVTNWNTSFPYLSNISQGWLENFTFTTLFNTLVNFTSFNITNGAKSYNSATNTTKVYLKNGTNQLTINISGWYTNTQNYTHTATQVKTGNLTDFYNTIITVRATNLSTPVLNFTTTITNTTLGFAESNITNGASIIHRALQGYTYYLTFAKTDLSSKNTSFTVNNNSYSYTFLVIPAPAINLTFYDEITDSLLISENITLEIINAASSQNLTFYNTKYINLTGVFGETILRYSTASYAQRDYIINLDGGGIYNLRLYDINLSLSQTVTITVTDTANTLIENATVSLLRYFVACNCYRIVQMTNTGAGGTGIFYVQALDGHYKWSVTYKGTVYYLSTTSEQINSNTRTFVIDLGSNFYSGIQLLPSLSYATTYNKTTETISYIYSDPTSTVTGGCLRVTTLTSTDYTTFNEKCVDGFTGSVFITLTNPNTTNYYYQAGVNTSSSFTPYIVTDTGSVEKTPSLDFGSSGIFLSIGVLIVLVTIFSFSATAVILISVVGTMAISFLGIMPLQYNFLAGFAALTIGVTLFLMRS